MEAPCHYFCRFSNIGFDIKNLTFQRKSPKYDLLASSIRGYSAMTGSNVDLGSNKNKPAIASTYLLVKTNRLVFVANLYDVWFQYASYEPPKSFFF